MSEILFVWDYRVEGIDTADDSDCTDVLGSTTHSNAIAVAVVDSLLISHSPAIIQILFVVGVVVLDLILLLVTVSILIIVSGHYLARSPVEYSIGVNNKQTACNEQHSINTRGCIQLVLTTLSRIILTITISEKVRVNKRNVEHETKHVLGDLGTKKLSFTAHPRQLIMVQLRCQRHQQVKNGLFNLKLPCLRLGLRHLFRSGFLPCRLTH